MAWEIASAILTALGGAAIIVLGLSAFLGKTIATRIAQNQNDKILAKLEELKSELSLTQKSYEQQLEHVVGYYSLYYQHYRRCQKVAESEILRHPETGDRCTKKVFEDEIDEFMEKWDYLEPRIRLILPARAYKLHEESIDNFNKFKELLKALPNNMHNEKEALREQFKVIDKAKTDLECCLRSYLRTNEIGHN